MIAKCDDCERNHPADLYKEYRAIDSVKRSGKWWDFCERHFTLYEENVCEFMDGLGLEGE